MTNPCRLCCYASIDHRGYHKPDPLMRGKCRECSDYRKHLEQLKSKQTYQEGQPITSISQFADYRKDHSFVYWNHKIKHMAILISLQYRTVENALQAGLICEAIKKGE